MICKAYSILFLIYIFFILVAERLEMSLLAAPHFFDYDNGIFKGNIHAL